MTIEEIENLCDFYVIELYECLLFDDKFVVPENPIHGLKHTEVSSEDFNSIVQFGKIIKNYQKMRRLEENIYCHYSGLPSPMAYI